MSAETLIVMLEGASAQTVTNTGALLTTRTMANAAIVQADLSPGLLGASAHRVPT